MIPCFRPCNTFVEMISIVTPKGYQMALRESLEFHLGEVGGGAFDPPTLNLAPPNLRLSTFAPPPPLLNEGLRV